jgi:hypothetical protein
MMSDFKPVRGDLTAARSTLTHDKTCSMNVRVGSARVCDCHMAVIADSSQRIFELKAKNKRLEAKNKRLADFVDSLTKEVQPLNNFAPYRVLAMSAHEIIKAVEALMEKDD